MIVKCLKVKAMFVPFENIPDPARIWIYQAKRKLMHDEEIFITNAIRQFVESWSSHGNILKGSVAVFYNRFIILASDESLNSASGCSIDKSVNAVKNIGDQLQLNLIDRQIAFLQDNEVKTVELKSFRELIEKNIITPDTFIFNNTIQDKGSLNTKWKVHAGDSWASRYFLKYS